MKIDVRYNKEETKAIMTAAHVAKFGPAPDGCEWKVEVTYCGRCEVSSRLIETETPEADKVAE